MKLALITALAVAWVRLAAAEPDAAFREPFTLRIGVDEGHFYEQKIGRIPYVANGAIYVFCGEEFGVHLTIEKGVVTGLQYTPDATAAELGLKFYQEKVNGHLTTMLRLTNRTGARIAMDALMVVIDRKQPLRTSILPVQTESYEMWPHPIVQLALMHLRVAEAPAKPAAAALATPDAAVRSAATGVPTSAPAADLAPKAGVRITVLMYSGGKDTAFDITDAKTIATIMNSALSLPAISSGSSTAKRAFDPVLGYHGIEVQNASPIARHVGRLVVHGGAIEIYGTNDRTPELRLDDQRRLETELLKLAVDHRAITERVAASINASEP